MRSVKLPSRFQANSFKMTKQAPFQLIGRRVPASSADPVIGKVGKGMGRKGEGGGGGLSILGILASKLHNYLHAIKIISVKSSVKSEVQNTKVSFQIKSDSKVNTGKVLARG